MVGIQGGNRLVPRSAQALLQALPLAGVTRLVFLGGGGSLEYAPGHRFMDSPDFPPEYLETALDQAEALAILRAAQTPVEWSYISPPPVHLVPGDKTGHYRAEVRNTPLVDERGDSRKPHLGLRLRRRSRRHRGERLLRPCPVHRRVLIPAAAASWGSAPPWPTPGHEALIGIVSCVASPCPSNSLRRGETVRWQPVSPTLMARLTEHGQERHAPPGGQLLRYRNGRPITSRRYDDLWARIGRVLPWVRTQQISMHWIHDSDVGRGRHPRDPG